MLIRRRRVWDVPDHELTDEALVLGRRDLLRAMIGALGGGAPIAAIARQAEAAPRNPAFTVPERGLTPERLATTYNNFYEFSTDKKKVHRRVGGFQTDGWTVRVHGRCERPKIFDLDELLRRMPVEERVYRFRCVEAWAMTVPWTGFPLAALLDEVAPLSDARYVRFVSAARPDEMPGLRRSTWYPWPYHEALSLREAQHPLAFLATGLYGKNLPRQNGAPIRLVVPWKYGFKSAKSIVEIELVAATPKTFWSTVEPSEYGFWANVQPSIPHPRWSQATERLLGTPERRVPTLPFNGYGDLVAELYPGGDARAYR